MTRPYIEFSRISEHSTPKKAACPQSGQAASILFISPAGLLGAEDPVAGIAQTGDDVGMVVQLLIAGSQVQLHIRVGIGPYG